MSVCMSVCVYKCVCMTGWMSVCVSVCVCVEECVYMSMCCRTFQIFPKVHFPCRRMGPKNRGSVSVSFHIKPTSIVFHRPTFCSIFPQPLHSVHLEPTFHNIGQHFPPFSSFLAYSVVILTTFGQCLGYIPLHLAQFPDISPVWVWPLTDLMSVVRPMQTRCPSLPNFNS